MLAAKWNRRETVEVLLNAEANPFLKDQLGKEAKDYNISIRHVDQSSQTITGMI